MLIGDTQADRSVGILAGRLLRHPAASGSPTLARPKTPRPESQPVWCKLIHPIHWRVSAERLPPHLVWYAPADVFCPIHSLPPFAYFAVKNSLCSFPLCTAIAQDARKLRRNFHVYKHRLWSCSHQGVVNSTPCNMQLCNHATL
jgi:hypothetical protein